MKKKLLLFITLIILIPCIVKADAGAPMIRPYEMVVVNPDGIDCTSYQNKTYHLKKDDVFLVNFEFENNYSITLANENNCELKSLSGAVLVADEIDPVKAVKENDQYINKSSTTRKAMVNADSGVDVKKGPSNTYETVGHLDKGTELKYTYSTSDVTHIYVDTGTVKGWVEVLDAGVLIENDDKYVVYKEIELSCTTIPKNTIIKPKYRADSWSRFVLVEAEGCSKEVDNFYGDNITRINQIEYQAKKELTIYEYADNTGKELGKIPADSKYISYANVSTQGDEIALYYVKYEDITGWIKTNYKDIEFIKNYEDDDIDVTEEEDDIIETPKEVEDPESYVTNYVVIGLSLAVIVLIILVLIEKRKRKTPEA